MQASNEFERTFGFRRRDVRLDNWRIHPFSRWSFQNVGEVVPSAKISCSPLAAEGLLGLDDLLPEEAEIGGRRETISDFLVRSHTDALAVMKRGKFIGDYNAGHMAPFGPHIVFSISKSLTAILAGSLQAEGLLDPSTPVIAYIPEALGSAYADATVQHVLDMAVSLDFVEAYLDPDGAFARYRRATLWNPGGGRETLREFILSIGKAHAPHGAPFRYRSPNSDLLGLILEAASGQRYVDLLAERLWQPIGATQPASVTVDGEGTARAAGGISTSARDLARVGEMMRLGGAAGARQIVPQGWVDDTVGRGDPSAWLQGDFPHLLPNGSYRNKWYQTGFPSGAFCAIGIHGQWLYVDPATETVIVKMSSQPEPVDDALDLECLDFFQALSAMV